MKKRTRGVTLIELMVTIAVVAIIAAIAAPPLMAMRDQHRIRSAAEAVYAHLQFARTESVKQDRNLWVHANTGTSWCIGISNATGCDCNTAGSCRFGPAAALVEHNVASGDFVGISLAATQTDFEFNSRRGTVVTGGGTTITLTGANSYQAQISTDLTGRIRLCGNMGRYPAC
ncbi:pilus assembly FimT family protein [Hydrogenophaga aquatica]